MTLMILSLTLLLLVTNAGAASTYYTRQSESQRQGRTLKQGSDSYSCAQATNAQTPKLTINAGISCLAPGDTLMIGPGNYKELIFGSYQGSTSCSSVEASRMQPCAIVPNGIDVDHPTRVIGDGSAVLSPTHEPDGGGGIITLYQGNRYLHFEGLRLLMNDAPGSAGSIMFGGASYVTFTRSETSGAENYAAKESSYLTITHNYLHHAGNGTCDTD